MQENQPMNKFTLNKLSPFLVGDQAEQFESQTSIWQPPTERQIKGLYTGRIQCEVVTTLPILSS